MTARKRGAAKAPSSAAKAERDDARSPGVAAGKKSENPLRRSSSGQEELTLGSLVPAIAATSLVSVGSYFSCDSIELAEDALVATVRTILQLSLLAAMLSPLFRFVENQTEKASSLARMGSKGKPSFKERARIWLARCSAPFLVLAYVFCFMLPLAAYEASSRTKLTLRPQNLGIPFNNIVLLSVMVSLFTAVSAMGAIAIFLIVKPEPRYSPRHVIPLCGMLFNNALSAISLALDILLADLQTKQRDAIELMVSFGASPWAASRTTFRTVLASSLKPQINSMNVIGLVAIPGMMTGQVLGGASPTRAARYQMIIMCLILAANFISVGMTAEFVIWNAFDSGGALRDDWIVDNESLRVSQLMSSLFALSTPADWGRTKESESLGQGFDDGDNSVIAVELSTKDQTIAAEPSDTSPLLQVDLHGSFAKGMRTMAANFTIPSSGDIAILQGPSGVGKSVLLKTIAALNSGFVPTTSHSSMPITLSGKDRESFHPSEWRQSVLYLPQQGASMLPGTPHSFLRFISSSLNHKHIQQLPTLESLTSQTMSYIEKWGLQSSKLSQPFAKLSGGESQRILLAIALATRPKLLLADEATSALDSTSKLKVEESLKESAESGCSMVMISHDDDQVKRIGTVLLSLNEVPS